MNIMESLKKATNLLLGDLNKMDCRVVTDFDGNEFSMTKVEYNEEIGIYYYVSDYKEPTSYMVESKERLEKLETKIKAFNELLEVERILKFATVHENFIDDILNDTIDISKCEIIDGVELVDPMTIKIVTKEITSKELRELINDRTEYIK